MGSCAISIAELNDSIIEASAAAPASDSSKSAAEFASIAACKPSSLCSLAIWFSAIKFSISCVSASCA